MKEAPRRLKWERPIESVNERGPYEYEVKVKEVVENEREATHLQAALPVSQLSNAFESKMPQIVCEGKYNIWHG